MNDELNLIYITDFDKEKERILELYHEYYGENGLQRFSKRIPWYNSYNDFHMLMAEYNGKFVGQACCYKADICVCGCISSIYWGVDTFVLSSMRGKGIGKKLQAKLHEDWQNFSSAWYSETNGIIKKKCGGSELFPVSFSYYPVSKLYATYIDRIIRKVTHKAANFHLPFPYLYASLNGYHKNKFTYQETIFNLGNITSIQSWLSASKYDFYVLRSVEFVNWKYINNPNLRYHILEVSENANVCGYIVFSHIFTTDCLGGKANVSNLLDYVFALDTDITIKDIVCLIAKYYKQKGEYLDGVRALGDSDYKFIQKTIAPSPLLSTMKDVSINNPYLTYIDQDMEQMWHL